MWTLGQICDQQEEAEASGSERNEQGTMSQHERWAQHRSPFGMTFAPLTPRHGHRLSRFAKKPLMSAEVRPAHGIRLVWTHERSLRMSRLRGHAERHSSSRIGWLRAAVLGANDGIVSTASLIVGVAAADATRSSVLLAGVAALFAGAMSMAAGEYVSVSSQADTEKADLARERAELQFQPEFEQEELTRIYQSRGVDRDTAASVARQMMAADALTAHARDELGLSEVHTAQPLQAAMASAATFTAGASAPLAVVPMSPVPLLVPAVAVTSLACLAVLGALGARAGGAPMGPSVLRVTFWGMLAMGVTAGVGRLFGGAVG
jgi:VIT1/CCC1 family predicted Fe2+/Mn2+ transporter